MVEQIVSSGKVRFSFEESVKQGLRTVTVSVDRKSIASGENMTSRRKVNSFRSRRNTHAQREGREGRAKKEGRKNTGE